MQHRTRRDLLLGNWATTAAVGGLLTAAWVVGCDSKKDTPPPETPTTAPAMTTQPSASATPAKASPTTQDLLAAPRHSLVLGGFPLRLSVPEGWKLTTVGTNTFLEGQAPHGDVRIQLTPSGQFMKPGTLDAMQKQATSQAAKDPSAIQVIPMREIGGTAKVMERREVQHLTVTRDDGSVQPVDRMEWTIRVFIPQEPDYGLDVLSFMGLSVEQYRQDKDFLEGILRTLHYDASGGALD